jgi:two-component system cell cycle response regulator
LEDRSFKPDRDLERSLRPGAITLDATLPPEPWVPPTEDEILAAPRVCDHPTLTMIIGPQAGSVFRLEKTMTLVGRGADCQILVDHPGVSRHHASILQTGSNVFELQDLGSRNGTTVRGNPVIRSSLDDGDRIGIGSGVMFRFALADELEAIMLKRQYESSILDALTGAANRRHLDDRLASEVAYAKRHGIELCLLLIDVDHFKQVNDQLGHPAGDHVLRELSSIVKRALRIEDVFARYGGEEFAIVSRSTDRLHGLLLGERIRHLIQSTTFEYEHQSPSGSTERRRIEVTVSVGIACLTDCGTELTPERLVRSADVALYLAKTAGRNCCRSIEEPTG